MAILLFAVASAAHMRDWFLEDLMPPGDFAGYASAIRQVRDWLLLYGRVPAWCSECFGGTSYFVSSLKEYLAFPLAVSFGSVLATKLMFMLAKLGAALGLYAVVVRLFGSPIAGILAGYAYGFGAVANHEIAHLDVPVSQTLFPLVFLASLELLRLRSWCWTIALGVLVACQFSNNWVHALVSPLVFLALLVFRPWRGASGAENPLVNRALAARWSLLASLALLVFLCFGGSQLAWLLSDARHHLLLPSDLLAKQQLWFIERSPFLFLNRTNWLASWLATHQPPGLEVSVVDGERRYLGLVALVVCIGGWFAVRRHAGRRRWYQLATLLLLGQYWISLGSRTLLWQVAQSLHWSDGLQAQLSFFLVLAAIGCLLWSAWGLVWRRHSGASPRRVGPARLLFLALLFFFPTHSLFDPLCEVLPPLGLMRAPGKFFDTAVFWVYLIFGLALASLLHGIRRTHLSHAFAVAIGLLLVVDFWPSTQTFSSGISMAPLRRARKMIDGIPTQGAPTRLALSPTFSPVVSWLTVGSPLGHTWSWLGWQAGVHWPGFMAASAWHGEGLTERQSPLKLDERAALLAIGRLPYLLTDRQDSRSARVSSRPWERVASDERFALWRQPSVVPMSTGYRSFVVFISDSQGAALRAVAQAFPYNTLVISGEEPYLNREALMERATVVACQAESSPVAAQCRDAHRRHPEKVFDLDSDSAVWSQHLRSAAQPLLEVSYHRPAPEEIVLETQAGDRPALVFVSEGFHPWWRATVDGSPAQVLRAQTTFMAIPLDPGFHRIVIRFVPPWPVAMAEYVTAFSWIALAVGGACALVARWHSPAT